VIIVGDEADPLNGDVLIKFVPIGRIGLDDHASLHGGRIIKLDFPLQEPLGDQDAGVYTPLFRRLALGCNDLVEIGTGWDAKLERSYASEYCATS
jgi:hypothetical protein